MKTRLILIIFSILTLACSDDNTSSSKQTSVINTVNSGTWRITYFYDSDTDETASFSGYSFTFGSSDVLTATNGSSTQTGTWSVSNSNDDTLDDLHFNINFTTPASFEELSDDWHIIETTDTKIKLTDVSGGGGGTDYLTFEKN